MKHSTRNKSEIKRRAAETLYNYRLLKGRKQLKPRKLYAAPAVQPLQPSPANFGDYFEGRLFYASAQFAAALGVK